MSSRVASEAAGELRSHIFFMMTRVLLLLLLLLMYKDEKKKKREKQSNHRRQQDRRDSRGARAVTSEAAEDKTELELFRSLSKHPRHEICGRKRSGGMRAKVLCEGDAVARRHGIGGNFQRKTRIKRMNSSTISALRPTR